MTDLVLCLAYLLSIYLFLQHSNTDGISSLVCFDFTFQHLCVQGFLFIFHSSLVQQRTGLGP